MPTGQFYPGQVLDEAPIVCDNTLTTNKGITAGGVAPTVAVGVGGGASWAGSITGLRGTDQAATFTLNAGTANTATGTAATVVFGNPFATAPSAVVVDAADTSGSGALSAGVSNITNLGFSIVTAAPTASHTYTVSYIMIH